MLIHCNNMRNQQDTKRLLVEAIHQRRHNEELIAALLDELHIASLEETTAYPIFKLQARVRVLNDPHKDRLGRITGTWGRVTSDMEATDPNNEDISWRICIDNGANTPIATRRKQRFLRLVDPCEHPFLPNNHPPTARLVARSDESTSTAPTADSTIS